MSQQPPAPQHPWDLINQPAAEYRGYFIRPRGLLSANSPLRMSRGAASGVPVSFLAIVSLMLSVLVPPAGIVCGHIALARIRRLHQGGRPIALAGTILGYVVTALWAIAITLAIVVVSLRLGPSSWQYSRD
jgi:peptidyl-prolyl cis-trans isomerase B (cyclophilin B)